MSLIAVGGEPGCRTEEIALLTARDLGWKLVIEAQFRDLLVREFGSEDRIPDRAWPAVTLSVLARLATQHRIVTSVPGAEFLDPKRLPGLLRVWVVAPESWRVGSVMLERRSDRVAARKALAELDDAARAIRRARFGRATLRPEQTDVLVNVGTLDPDVAAAAVIAAARARRMDSAPLLDAGAEAHIQFQARVDLSRHGVSPPDRMQLRQVAFVHPSEETFARVLDFYRIAWQYEPRSFPIEWDRDGKVSEAFTPDFYLPEFDLYVELTAMKQSLVTRKNRKIKLVRQLYPHVNIQVFYARDIENLIFKYGLAPEREPVAHDA